VARVDQCQDGLSAVANWPHAQYRFRYPPRQIFRPSLSRGDCQDHSARRSGGIVIQIAADDPACVRPIGSTAEATLPTEFRTGRRSLHAPSCGAEENKSQSAHLTERRRPAAFPGFQLPFALPARPAHPGNASMVIVAS
jgi:hypothetical protein